MIGRALARGVKDAARRPGLVALLWGWNLALAALITLPFWAWVYAATSAAPVTDALLDGVEFGLLTHLIVAGSGASLAVFAAAAGLALLALLSGAFLSGGILEAVTSDGDGRSLAHRFFRGAGHFFGRFVRLLAIAGVTALPVVGLVSVGLSAITKPLSSGGSEPAAFWASIIALGGTAVALAYFMLALDYARAAAVLSGSRAMLRTWLRSLAFVVRRAPGVAVIGLLAALAVAATIGITALYDIGASGRTWGAILGTLLVHQAMLLVRTAARVGQVSAQAEYWKGLQAIVVAAPEASGAAPELGRGPADVSPETAAQISVQAPAATGEGSVERE